MKTLLELSAQPTSKRRVLEYGADGNKVVRHYYDVFPVVGTVYAADHGTNQYGERQFDTFIFFDGVPDGLKVENRNIYRDYMTDDRYAEGVKNFGGESPEAFVAAMNLAMESNRFIGNAWIEFVRQWNPERADVYAQHRAAWYARKEEEQRVREEQHRAEEAERARQAAEEDRLERAKYHGFADDLSPMRFGKLSAAMEKLIRTSEYGVQNKRAFVESLIKDGWTPKKEEGVTSWYGSRWNVKESKPRTEYRIAKDSVSYKVSKTEFDYAVYLTQHENWND